MTRYDAHASTPSLMPPRINIALAGLGFGAEFIPIYQAHSHTSLVAVCQRNAKKMGALPKAFNIGKAYTDYDEMLRDPEIDAVHINTPIPDHAEQTIKALKAGKHVACTVPMATSVADCKRIVELTRKTGLKYMMMETVVYARKFLHVQDLYRKGDLGKIQFLHKTWTAGPTTGPACRPCGTPLTASAPCWRSPTPPPNTCPVSVRARSVRH
ncbi:MAG: Gfo/Idh/MocA family oxidoreductase [Candidatus Synoicihabitans palmerolidicus]|nr:Gfo/Idh/MocA family oxidoreductase [Candidatus Synoicihabitans palmerolidicus]